MKWITREPPWKNKIACPIFLLYIFHSMQCSSGQTNENNTNAALVLTASMPMPGVIGRIDQMAYNVNCAAPSHSGKEAQLMIFQIK